MELLLQLGMTVIVAVFASGGVYIGVRKDLHYLRRDTDQNARAINVLHSRINRIAQGQD